MQQKLSVVASQCARDLVYFVVLDRLVRGDTSRQLASIIFDSLIFWALEFYIIRFGG